MAKILFLTRSFYPNIGGVEKHIFEISEILIKKGHDITVITESTKNDNTQNYQSGVASAKILGNSNKIRILKIQARKESKLKKFFLWFDLLMLWKEISKSEIVHCHDVFYWYLPFRIIFPFKKVYTTFHGYEGNNIPTIGPFLMHKISELLSFGNICVGDFLKKWYKTKPTIVTYGAVSKKFLEETSIKVDKASKENKKIKDKKNLNFNKVVFIGRLEKETGVMTYLKALKILKDKRINLSLDIYGEGSMEIAVKKYGKDNKLDLRIEKPRLNIENVLKNYEYIFCSRYLSILEGMAAYVPIFAEYNNSIKKDYLEMSPFAKYISISRDAESIAKNVEEYLINKENIDLDKGYEWVKDKDWEYMANLYLRLWKL